MKFVSYLTTVLASVTLLGEAHYDHITVGPGDSMRAVGGDVGSVFVNDGTLIIDGDVRTHGSIFINDSNAHLVIKGDLDAHGDIFLTRGELTVEGTLSMQHGYALTVSQAETTIGHLDTNGRVVVTFGKLTVLESSTTNTARSIHIENHSRFITSGAWDIGHLEISGATLQPPSSEYTDITLRVDTLAMQRGSVITTDPYKRDPVGTRDGGSVSVHAAQLYFDGTIAVDGERSIVSDWSATGHGGTVFIEAELIESFTGSIFARGTSGNVGGNGGAITVRALTLPRNADDIPRNRLHVDGGIAPGGLPEGESGSILIQTEVPWLQIDRSDNDNTLFVSFNQPANQGYILEASTDGGTSWSALEEFKAITSAKRVSHKIPVSEQAGAAMFRLVVGD